ncbi:TetR/AcrR family transcriptional regulator [Amorphus sp. 3PC139-8]
MTKKKTKKSNGKRLAREDWVLAAKEILISEGVRGLSLRRLATSLNMTTGGFYWLFENFDELLDDLRKHWESENSKAFDENFDCSELNSKERYIGYLRILFNTSLFDPSYDNAVRDWARSSPETAKNVRRVDARRIAQLKSMYEDFGYGEGASLVKAESAYYHQVGYFTVGVSENLESRLSKIPYYAEFIQPGIIPKDTPIEELKKLLIIGA